MKILYFIFFISICNYATAQLSTNADLSSKNITNYEGSWRTKEDNPAQVSADVDEFLRISELTIENGRIFWRMAYLDNGSVITNLCNEDSVLYIQYTEVKTIDSTAFDINGNSAIDINGNILKTGFIHGIFIPLNEHDPASPCQCYSFSSQCIEGLKENIELIFYRNDLLCVVVKYNANLYRWWMKKN